MKASVSQMKETRHKATAEWLPLNSVERYSLALFKGTTHLDPLLSAGYRLFDLFFLSAGLDA